MKLSNDPQPHMTNRRKQAEESREKLLKVAFRLIREKGFDHVKVEDICHEAQMSVGAFYHYFKNKSDIVVGIYRHVDQHFLAEVIPSIQDPDSMECVLQYVDAQILCAYEVGPDIGVQLYKAQLTEGTEFFLSADRALPAGMTRLISHLQELGVLKSHKDAGEITSEILIITRGLLYNWAMCRGGYDCRALARELISNYLLAYRQN